MKSVLKTLAWMAAGGALGLGGAVALREANRSPLAEAIPLVAPPSGPEPAPPPAPRPTAFDYFGFELQDSGRAAPPPPAPKLLRYAPLKDRCVAGFDATSTLHDFRGWTKSVRGWIRFERDRLEETARASISVDARTLDTGHADRDADMHRDHLHSARHPELKFELREFRRTSKDAYRMKGVLEIHGTAKEVEVPGTFSLRSDGVLHAKGELRVRMSEFGIPPPVTALVIRVDDEIKVWFELWARQEEEAP